MATDEPERRFSERKAFLLLVIVFTIMTLALLAMDWVWDMMGWQL